MICFLLPYIGPVVVHCGRCRRKGMDFSYLPDFLIPYNWLSIRSLRALLHMWKETGSAEKACGGLTSELGESYDQSLSSVYHRLYVLLSALRLQADPLMIDPPQTHSVSEFDKEAIWERMDRFFEKFHFCHVRSERNRAPPRC